MSIFSTIVSILSLKFFFLSSFVVDGPSMQPTLHSGDIFLVEPVWEQGMSYDRGDLVVFSLEEEPDYYYVKRIIGMPGEDVEIRSNGVYVDGVRLAESYLPAGMSSVPRAAAYQEDFQQAYKVPDDHYFVLGDNREQSLDSRHFLHPFVAHDQIEGRHIRSILEQEESENWSTVVVRTKFGPVPFTVEVAETNDQRMQGLMFRQSLPKGHGMYFIFEEEANRGFWMKNTLIPLDMMFINAEGLIIHIEEMVQPCERDPCPSYRPVRPSKYVLEIGGGEAEEYGIEVGDVVTFIRSE